ncbi:MAG TPA: TAT-variant-translocated molybdopterin oxidoreductase [Terriglobia bacterium]|nr:TAT-variant-translocated molybdopterin oxidoreductase [Terriglobia bacterium]
MSERNHNPLDLVQIRAKLDSDAGQRFWRGLEELAGTQNCADSLDHEFPRDPAKEPREPGALSRRDVLKLMSASAAFAGLTACTKLPTEKIVPYVTPPEEIIPGKPLYYASTMPFGGFGAGVVVESHMGRPTKIEGNPDHPASLGAADLFAQASVLTLYDPDRSKVVISSGRIGSWSDFLAVADQARQKHLANKGAGLRILTETISSPTLADQLRTVLAQFPMAKWHQYEPCGRDTVREGARLAFGEYVNTYYRLDRADVILSLDANFLCYGPGAVRYARDFSDRRRITGPDSTMNRLYVVESMLTSTGATADHRLRLRSSAVEALARSVAIGLGVQGIALVGARPNVPADWIPALLRDLQAHRGASLVIAGEQQPPAVHGLAHAINDALGNVGKTVVYTAPVEAAPCDQMQSLRDLVADIEAGHVETLVILGSNPLYTAPPDLDFGSKLLKVPLRIHLGLYDNETAQYCHWHIPEAHYLESWGDARAYDGTASIIQPLIAPLYDGKSAHELVALLLGHSGALPHDIVRDYWLGQKLVKEEAFEAAWESWLEKGVIPGTAFPPKPLNSGVAAAHISPGAQPNNSGSLEIGFRPDPSIWDGRFANNGWLQELPKPFTKLTWDNVALVSPRTAERQKLANEDVVELRYAGRSVRAPVFVMPGHADDSVTVHLGFGRRRAGAIGTGVGFDAYAIRPSNTPWIGTGLEISKTGERYHLVTTQVHHAIRQDGHEVEEESVTAEKRGLMRVATLAEFRQNPSFAADPEEEKSRDLTLYPNYPYNGYAWGISIDLNSCIGCNACVIACQSENNISVVGKTEVDAARDMQWLRVDTYYHGDLDDPSAYNEVVMCMQCENAPCELVCPVGATVHSPEGLNEMIYNRCVGTRYCSNNCPYKVRRFNFKLYSDWTTPSLYGLRNPNVTVRSRGVMEKCTYCIQRINAKKIQAELEDRQVRDGEIVTACQQTCPTQAIVFGNINDPNSRVAKLKGQSRDYSLLLDLNTRPRTTYLAKLRNPNPEIKE